MFIDSHTSILRRSLIHIQGKCQVIVPSFLILENSMAYSMELIQIYGIHTVTTLSQYYFIRIHFAYIVVYLFIPLYLNLVNERKSCNMNIVVFVFHMTLKLYACDGCLDEHLSYNMLSSKKSYVHMLLNSHFKEYMCLCYGFLILHLLIFGY